MPALTPASPSVPEAPLLEIENATVYRGRNRVFDRFSLTIPQHQQVVVAGPNGAGKTTLLKLVNRELYPVANPASSVRILGSDHWNVWELRRHIGIVSDDLQQRYPRHATGAEVVLSGFFSAIGMQGLLGARVSDDHRRRARAALEALGVGSLAETALGRMSTGQQRRCLLARALVHEPHTLILDEPTAGLDLAASFDFLRRIAAMIEAGRNVILVTHHLNDIPPPIDRVVLIRDGRVVADGSKQEVLTIANLSVAYGVPLRLLEADGYFFPYPAET